MTWDQIDDHAGAMLDHMAGPYQIPSVQQLLIPIAEEIQALETLLWQIFAARFVDAATDDALDILGAMVGEPDLGDSDASYRLRISMKLRAVYSLKGSADFWALLQLLVGITWAMQEAAGWVDVTQLSGALVIEPAALLRFLKIASADGVIVRLASLEGADAGPSFEFKSADGTIVGSEWDSADHTIAGAKWIGVRTL